MLLVGCLPWAHRSVHHTSLELALKKWKANFRTEKQDYLSDVPLLPEIFRWKNPKRRVPFTFQSETFRKR